MIFEGYKQRIEAEIHDSNLYRMAGNLTTEEGKHKGERDPNVRSRMREKVGLL